MQRSETTQNKSEFTIFNDNSEKLTSSLTKVVDKFDIKRNVSIFNLIKAKGYAISSLVNILIILPFLGFATVHSLMKAGLKTGDFKAKKDAYYQVKNNPLIDWRKLLFLHVKRFIYLINHNVNLKKDGKTAFVVDDTDIEKTGKKIELVGSVYNHVSQMYIFGYKLLVLGFWDGGSFIPIDFSLHREKGKKHLSFIKASKQADKNEERHIKLVLKLELRSKNQKERLDKHQNRYNKKKTRTNKNHYQNAQIRYNLINKEYEQSQRKLIQIRCKQVRAAKALKDFYNNGKLYGLTTKERKAQHKNAVESGSSGQKRRKEADSSKIEQTLKMLSRAVKQGIIPDYFMADSWFFCFELLDKLSKIKKGVIKLIAMAKLNNQKFSLSKYKNELSAKQILSLNQRNASYSKKYKSKYIKIRASYKGIKVNLFYIKMGKSKTWRLLVTTDLALNFNQLIELYQIRWSIEVFFKDAKQHLKLGSSESNNFDGQIADITISMLQYIMLIYFKRLNYQQSFGQIFKNISKELVAIDLLTEFLEILAQLVEILCEIAGIDFMEFQEQIIREPQISEKIMTLFLPKNVDNIT